MCQRIQTMTRDAVSQEKQVGGRTAVTQRCAVSAHRQTTLKSPYRKTLRVLRCGDAFGEEDVCLSETVRVGQHTGDPEPEPKIELERVIVQIPDAGNGARNVRIEIRAAQRRLTVFVVAAGPERQSPATGDTSLEILDE